MAEKITEDKFAALTGGPDDGQAGISDGSRKLHGHMRASTADRDRAIEVLKAAFVEGRLTKEELDLRVGQAFVAASLRS